MNPITGLLAALGALTVVYLAGWATAVSRACTGPEWQLRCDGRAVSECFSDCPRLLHKLLRCPGHRLVRYDHCRLSAAQDGVRPHHPGTLNVGHTLPTVVQAFIFTAIIPVDVLTLFLMIAAAVLGAWLGAGIVCGWSKRKVQIGMGVALLSAATFMLMRQLSLFPAGSEEIGVRGVKLVLATGGNFMLGALMTLGIGLYAPCMILVSLLGMSERTAFPVMMGSCAFLMPIGSLRFIREQAYSLRNALGLAIGGVAGSYVAAKFFESLNIRTVRWLVIVVVLYTAITMLISASTERAD